MVTAILFTKVTAAVAGRRRLLLAALASAALVADGWTTVPVVAAPRQVDVPAERPQGLNVLELPLGDLVADAAAQYRAAIGGWRSFNGYSGYSPPHYQALRHASESSPVETVDLLRRYGPLLVTVDTARDGDGRWAAAVAAHAAAEPVGAGNGMRLFHFDPQPPGTHDAIERPLRIATITASCGADATTLIADGNIATAWECGVGASPLQLVFELDAQSTLTAITERSGRRPTDPTARLAVQTSIDGQSWDDAWEGSIAFPALAGSLSDPLQNAVTVRLHGRRARFVRLQHTGATADYRWWIAELEITGTP
jgi:hypothetical protein